MNRLRVRIAGAAADLSRCATTSACGPTTRALAATSATFLRGLFHVGLINTVHKRTLAQRPAEDRRVE